MNGRFVIVALFGVQPWDNASLSFSMASVCHCLLADAMGYQGIEDLHGVCLWVSPGRSHEITLRYLFPWCLFVGIFMLMPRIFKTLNIYMVSVHRSSKVDTMG